MHSEAFDPFSSGFTSVYAFSNYTHRLGSSIVIVDISFLSSWKSRGYKAVQFGQRWHLTDRGLLRGLVENFWRARQFIIICDICGLRFKNRGLMTWRRGGGWVAQGKKCISCIYFVRGISLLRTEKKWTIPSQFWQWNIILGWRASENISDPP